MSGYAINPMAPFPKRWEDDHGGIRVMCEPCEGYVMVRRKGAMPFVVSVRDLLSGNFKPAEAHKPRSSSADEGARHD